MRVFDCPWCQFGGFRFSFLPASRSAFSQTLNLRVDHVDSGPLCSHCMMRHVYSTLASFLVWPVGPSSCLPTPRSVFAQTFKVRGDHVDSGPLCSHCTMCHVYSTLAYFLVWPVGFSSHLPAPRSVFCQTFKVRGDHVDSGPFCSHCMIRNVYSLLAFYRLACGPFVPGRLRFPLEFVSEFVCSLDASI